MTSVIAPGELAVGMQLPIQSQSTIYAEQWEAAAGVDELASIARAADRNGFCYVAVCDHVAIPADLAPKMSTSWWDTIATLGYLAAITERVRLMSHVYVLPYRHPLVTAKAFLTLDRLSNGRAILGVGAGHVEAEFAVLGADYERRGSVLEDAIDVVRAAFVDEFASIDTTTWSVHDMGLQPRPIQSGGPPIWVGGSSQAAIRRAAEKGDGWLPQGPPAEGMAAAIDRIVALREQAGRADAPFAVGANTEPVYVGEPDWHVGKWCLIGAPERVAERLRSYRDIGCNQLQLRFRSRSCAELLDQIDVFGSDVLPLLND